MAGNSIRSVKMSVTPGRTEISSSPQDMLGLPILIAVVLVAVVARQFLPPPASPVVLIVCGVLAVLDGFFVAWVLRQGGPTFVVTHDRITFTRRPSTDQEKSFSIDRASGSSLRFRLQYNGFIGGQMQYLLKLRDDVTGTEVPATSFGKRKVRQACESQGWTFG